MKRQNQNRPSPFPGRMSQDATKPAISFYGRPIEQGRPLYFFHVVSSIFFLSIYLVSLPNLSRRRLDVCHTCTHTVTLVRIQDAGLCWERLAGNAGPKIAKKSPPGHHRTNLSGYIFATKAHIDNRKNLLNSNVSFTCPHNTVNFGPQQLCLFCCSTFLLIGGCVLLLWSPYGIGQTIIFLPCGFFFFLSSFFLFSFFVTVVPPMYQLVLVAATEGSIFHLIVTAAD